MRITIESTNEQFIKETGPCKATVELSDDSDIYDVKEAVERVLVGYGFHPNTVDEAFEDENDK